MYHAKFFVEMGHRKYSYESVLSGSIEEGLENPAYLDRAIVRLEISPTRREKVKLVNIKILNGL